MLKRPSRAMNPHSNPDGGGGWWPPTALPEVGNYGSLVSDFHITHILYGWMIILPDIEIQIETSTTLLADIPAFYMPIGRSHWFVVKRPIYDASNGDYAIDRHHVNTTIMTIVWIFHEIY